MIQLTKIIQKPIFKHDFLPCDNIRIKQKLHLEQITESQPYKSESEEDKEEELHKAFQEQGCGYLDGGYNLFGNSMPSDMFDQILQDERRKSIKDQVRHRRSTLSNSANTFFMISEYKKEPNITLNAVKNRIVRSTDSEHSSGDSDEDDEDEDLNLNQIGDYHNNQQENSTNEFDNSNLKEKLKITHNSGDYYSNQKGIKNASKQIDPLSINVVPQDDDLTLIKEATDLKHSDIPPKYITMSNHSISSMNNYFPIQRSMNHSNSNPAIQISNSRSLSPIENYNNQNSSNSTYAPSKTGIYSMQDLTSNQNFTGSLLPKNTTFEESPKKQDISQHTLPIPNSQQLSSSSVPLHLTSSSYQQQVTQQQQMQLSQQQIVMQQQLNMQLQQIASMQSQQIASIQQQQMVSIQQPSTQQQQASGIMQPRKKQQVMESSKDLYKGTLKFFDQDKNYGFIVEDESRQDVFVHFDDLQKAGIPKGCLMDHKHCKQVRFQFGLMGYFGKYQQSRKAVEIQLLSDTPPYLPVNPSTLRMMDGVYLSSNYNSPYFPPANPSIQHSPNLNLPHNIPQQQQQQPGGGVEFYTSPSQNYSQNYMGLVVPQTIGQSHMMPHSPTQQQQNGFVPYGLNSQNMQNLNFQGTLPIPMYQTPGSPQKQQKILQNQQQLQQSSSQYPLQQQMYLNNSSSQSNQVPNQSLQI